MEVILIEDVPNLGLMGDIVRVADGYGRNYLIPQKLALVANKRNRRSLEHQLKIVDAKKVKLRKRALEVLKEMDQVSVTIKKQAGESDRLFGSVTNRDIAGALQTKGFKIDRKQIIMERPIKALGIYRIPIRLTSDVHGEVKVWVAVDL